MLLYPLALVFPVAMAFAAANDLFTMRIPNKISLVLVAAFFAAAVLLKVPVETAGWHLACGLAVLAATFALFSMNWLGGGDAKLMAAAALWMGPDHVIPFLAYVTIFGGLLSVLVLSYRKLVPVSNLPLPTWALRLHESGTGIPYGIAIAASGLMIYPETLWFKAIAG